MKFTFPVEVEALNHEAALRLRNLVENELASAFHAGEIDDTERPHVGVVEPVESGEPNHNDSLVIGAARDEHEVEGTLEIDEGAKVSYSSDKGAYVQAWVWVGNDAIHAAGAVNPETDEPAESEGGHCD